MKNKYMQYIIAIATGIILATVVIGMQFFIRDESKKSSDFINSKIYKNIKSESTTRVTNKESNQSYEDLEYTDEKIAYITIDDGPSKYTNQILEILNENNVKGTFFLIDGNMKKHTEEVKNIVESGQSVGFHSVSHDKEVLYSTPEHTLDEFETCKETFKNITGLESNLIRIPYGSKPYMPEECMNILVENDFRIWDWNLDTEDWKGTSDNIVSNILYYARNKSELVILIHEKEQTVEALEGLIMVLKERGYTIMPITEDIQPHNYWNKNMD